jgi:hypothetical protein
VEPAARRRSSWLGFFSRGASFQQALWSESRKGVGALMIVAENSGLAWTEHRKRRQRAGAGTQQLPYVSGVLSVRRLADICPRNGDDRRRGASWASAWGSSRPRLSVQERESEIRNSWITRGPRPTGGLLRPVSRLHGDIGGRRRGASDGLSWRLSIRHRTGHWSPERPRVRLTREYRFCMPM